MKPYLKFKNNRISCEEIKFKTIMWEYFCWVLGGKPDGYEIEVQKRK